VVNHCDWCNTLPASIRFRGHTFMNMKYHVINLKVSTIYFTFIMHMYVEALILRDERRLRVFENRVLRRICGPKGDFS